MTLVEFLRDRLDEDEQIAALAGGGRWHAGEEDHEIRSAETVIAVGPWNCSIDVVDANHIVRHDPARVVAEVDAKRRIIEQCEANADDVEGGESLAAWVLDYLALPYRDHPDYQPEWAADLS